MQSCGLCFDPFTTTESLQNHKCKKDRMIIFSCILYDGAGILWIIHEWFIVVERQKIFRKNTILNVEWLRKLIIHLPARTLFYPPV